MRRIAWGLLLLFAFAIPWEYSLDLGEPMGNVARVAGVLLLLVAIPAVLQAGRWRLPGPLQWVVLAFYLWFCCSYFWTIDPMTTLDKIRGYFQEIMIVWLVWEFAESPRDLRWLLRAYVAGSWVLAVLTLANFVSPEASAAQQIRFVAEGQDPNDAARFLVLGFLSFWAFRWRRFSLMANLAGLAGCWRWAIFRSDSSQCCLRPHEEDFWLPCWRSWAAAYCWLAATPGEYLPGFLRCPLLLRRYG
jgi:hypothetical protein